MNRENAPWSPVTPAELAWTDKGDPVSQAFGDVYYSGEDGAACARIQVEGGPTEAVLEKLRGAPAIFDVQVVELT